MLRPRISGSDCNQLFIPSTNDVPQKERPYRDFSLQDLPAQLFIWFKVAWNDALQTIIQQLLSDSLQNSILQ